MVTLEGLRLRNGSPGVSGSFAASRVAVVGRSGAGKTRLLAALVRGDASEGVRARPSPAVQAGRVWRTRLATPQSVARYVFGARRESLAAALSTLGLWPVRHEPMAKLGAGAVAACELLPAFDPDAGFVAIDGHLDLVDPWVREAALEALAARDATVWVATRDMALADRLGYVVALRGGTLTIAGSVEDVLARLGPTRLEVETDDPGGAAAMVDAFEVQAAERGASVLLTAMPGQEAAARLLTHGYGTVKVVAVRRPSLIEALRPWT